MKKNILTISAILLIISFLYASKTKKEKCDPDELYEQTLKKLADFSLLKDYRFYMKEKKKSDPVETLYFPIILNRGMRYKFIYSQNVGYEGKLIMSLYTDNNNKPDFLFATNYEKAINKFYESIEFKADNTMKCFVAFSFLDGKEGCGVCVSSFLKN